MPEKAAAVETRSATGLRRNGSGQIAVFISRKDFKLYVRQNFAPLFDVPVTIAPSDRPLGTHVFTAEVDKNDANVLHWSVVSLPVPRGTPSGATRTSACRDGARSRARSRCKADAGAGQPRRSAGSHLHPRRCDGANHRSLSTGGSIIVSDQGIAAGETGEGTDFIVSLR